MYVGTISRTFKLSIKGVMKNIKQFYKILFNIRVKEAIIKSNICDIQ